jgi:4-methyl-5(b-hydroxyethyl)-thiazole monophosphate biosynthesis
VPEWEEKPMKQVAVLIADGFETTEALTVVDVLRRAGVRAHLVAAGPFARLRSAQQIHVTADLTLEALETDDVACYVVPGGIPLARALMANRAVCDLLVKAAGQGVTLAALSAGVVVLGKLGLLRGVRCVDFPDHDTIAPDALVCSERVVGDGAVLTASALADTLVFSLALVRLLLGEDVAAKTSESVHGALS